MSKPVFIHSDIAKSLPLYGSTDYKRSLNDSCHAASDFLIGEYGDNLSFPAFNYNFGGNLVFDVDNDKSQVGLLSEHMRLSDDYCRSPVPFFSVLSKHNDLCQYSKECHPFGKGSFFEWLHLNDGKIVGLGTKSIFTFLHYIEGLIPGGPLYRYEKEFKGLLKRKEGDKEVVCKMHVKPINGATEYDFALIERDLREENILADNDSKGILCSMQCSEVVSYMLSKYESDPLYGLTEKSKSALVKLTNNCSSRIKACDDVLGISNENEIQSAKSDLNNDMFDVLHPENPVVNDIIDVVSSVLTEEKITIESSMDNAYTWDSLNHMSIIIALKNQLSIDFSPAEVASATSVRLIYQKVYDS